METLNQFTGLYSLSKTMRFGLTLKEKKPKNDSIAVESLYQSHQDLKELVELSDKRIIEEKKPEPPVENLGNPPIEKLRDCLNSMQKYLNDWRKVYTRYDQLAVLKDFYRKLERKARFDGFWKDKKGQNQPQSQEIKLSSLKHKSGEKEIKDCIVTYWGENIRKANEKWHQVDSVLKQFEEAKRKNRDDKKLNQVELRKLFLSLANLVNDTLVPLCQRSITFPNADKLSDNARDKSVLDFIGDNEIREHLLDKITKLKEYFQDNGGYVPFGRVTLNQYTAMQKPNKTDKEIEDAIKNLGLSIIKSQNFDAFEHIEEATDKVERLNTVSLPLVERAQYFKDKTIPVGVRDSLAKYLAKDDTAKEKELIDLFEKIGMPKRPAKDYSDPTLKEKFDLRKYPLKVAFDYAWETVASKELHDDILKNKCKKYLKDIFDVDTDKSIFFNIYSDLNYMKIILSRIEYPTQNQLSKDNFLEWNRKVITILDGDDFSHFNKNADGSTDKKMNTAKTYVKTWLDKLEANIEQFDGQDFKKFYEDFKKKNKNSCKDFDDAKRDIGLKRGGLKQIIEETETFTDKKTGKQKPKYKDSKYKELTEAFKSIAVDFGKHFATLRDKFNEENEINKIEYYGVIVEDENADRYLLLSKLSESREEIKNIFPDKAEGLKTYKVKSLTSKTLTKLVKNKGAYKDFHISDMRVDFKKIKEEWSAYKNDQAFLKYLKKCLTDSSMAQAQNWSEFGLDFDKCNTYEEVEKELDGKAYLLQETRLSKATITNLVKNKGCYLLPIINQDLAREDRTAKNQFTKDWKQIFENKKHYRLHPEFNMAYRQPTPNYPNSEIGDKRYSRFQMIANFMCEIVPQSTSYATRKEQIQTFNDNNKQQKAVKDFDSKFKLSDSYFIFGIDRGIKQLATLCVLDQGGVIRGGFEIYTRHFDGNKKQWVHTSLERRNILDLTNLRAETTIDGKKVLVDLSKVEIKNQTDNKQNIKLKQLAYIRKLQYQMQTNPEKVKNMSDEDIENDLKDIITPYKEGTHYADLPIENIKAMLDRFKVLYGKTDQQSKQELKELCELDAADNLKGGIVANMVGVIAHLMEQYNYRVKISLENLTTSFVNQSDGLNEYFISRGMDFKEQENAALAGLGTYQFFEMQLLKKIFRIQQDDGNVLHLVPAFRSKEDYEKIIRRDKNDGDEYVNYPFGLVTFVDPRYTSRKCPICGKTDVKRNDNIITCKKCGAVSGKYSFDDKNRQFITNGDENGAYHIALKTRKEVHNEN
ncbi:MAG: transposase [Culturomica sp.]|jgi:hypothetical protein|nr:transposase [Culturomica sp.]